MSNLQTLQVTTAKEWRKLRESGIVYPFKSGLNARIRPVSIVQLFSLGKIPESLISLAHDITVGKPAQTTEISSEQAEKGLNSLKDLIGVLAVECFIEPKVSLEIPSEDDEDTIWLYDLTFDDQMELLEVCQAPASALNSFRKEQEGNVGAV